MIIEPNWTTSSRCAQGGCVGVDVVAGRVLVCNTNRPDVVQEWTVQEWGRLFASLRRRPDRPATGGYGYGPAFDGDGMTVGLARHHAANEVVHADPDEWAAFVAGVRSGEFSVALLEAAA